MTFRFARTLPFVLWLMLIAGPPVLAQPPADPAAFPPQAASETADSRGTMTEVRRAMLRLPLAAALGAMLGLRPRRKGTPPRQPAVIQTQIILAIVGSVVMLVVGTNIARAFGVVGAAGLVRYRAKVEDPKDAGVMLCTLAVGLASGVGLYALAIVSTAFIGGALWVIESFEDPLRHFELKIKAGDDTDSLRPKIEQILRRYHLQFELRTSSDEEVCYDVQVPFEVQTDRVSNSILDLDEKGHAAVDWSEKKKNGKK